MSNSGFLGSPKVQYFKVLGDGTSVPLSGGLVWSYTAGTTTLAPTYPTIQDSLDGTNANTNPVVLDSRGEAKIVLKGNTKLILEDDDINEGTGHGNQLWVVDNVGQGTADILDPNGNFWLSFDYNADAVNYFEIENAVTGVDPEFRTQGDDTTINMSIGTKGTTGKIKLQRETWIRTNNKLKFWNTANTFGSSIAAPSAQAADIDYTLPTSVSSNDSFNSYFLNCTAAGVMSWARAVPEGTVVAWAGTTPPTGWLVCDGSAVSRTTYPNLFSVCGTQFGAGDGSTTFNLPNQARRSIVGKGGTGTATLGNNIGATGGEETHVLTTAELASHTHALTMSNTTIGYSTGGTSFTGLISIGSTNTNSTGSDTGHNTYHPSLVMNHIIKI